jgi:hypothetical protein
MVRSETFARRFGIACMLVAFAAAVALAATGAEDARAARPKYARFFRAQKTISWSEPRWTTNVDCWHSWWTQASGRHTERYESTMPVRVLAYDNGSGYTFFQWRSWDPYDPGTNKKAMPGMGLLERRASRSTDWEAGHCGVRGVIIDDEGRERTTPVPPKPTDCGTRKPAVEGWIGVNGVYMHLDVGPFVDSQEPVMVFRRCELRMPDEMDERGWSQDVVGRYPYKDLWNPKKPVIKVSAREQYRRTIPLVNGRGTATTSGNVSWTVTLRRAPAARRGRR